MNPRPVTRRMRHDARLLAEPGVGALIGVDEAGRGALCGPVHAAAVLLTPTFLAHPWWRCRARWVDDSKKLQPVLRAELASEILSLDAEGALVAAVAHADVPDIERLNILGATQLAMKRALLAVFLRIGLPESDDALPLDLPGHAKARGTVPARAPAGISTETSAPGMPLSHAQVQVLVDGRSLRRLGVAHLGIVGGDGRSLVIAMASILAKCARDAVLRRLASQFPGYGWEVNKGYGTPEHREALRRLGPTPHHRDMFVRKVLAGSRDAEGQMELWGSGWPGPG